MNVRSIVIGLYRARTPVLGAAVVATLVWITLDLTLLQRVEISRDVRLSISLAAVSVLVLALLLSTIGPKLLPDHPVRAVRAPVTGRWLGMNSPSTAVPSHGTRAYGQAYAIDIVYEPDDPSDRPQFGGEPFRGATNYPSFGAPVYAMVNGTVVGTSGRHRDHKARSNTLALMYLTLEGMVRTIGGPRFLLGNQVTIRTSDGIFATVAHLQRGSVEVNVGDQVRAGDFLGRCGNSGNSSEPHVHAQLSDRKSFWLTEGLPKAFSGIKLEDTDELTSVDSLPGNGQVMVAPPVTSPRTRQGEPR